MMQVQKFTSGKGLEKLYHKKITAREIFDRSDKFTKSVFLKHFKIRLARALVNLIYTIDPDILFLEVDYQMKLNHLKK